MKASHWISIVLGAVVIGLTGIEPQLSGTVASVVHVLVAVAGALLPALGITSPSALKAQLPPGGAP
jgi:hypothetical protein